MSASIANQRAEVPDFLWQLAERTTHEAVLATNREKTFRKAIKMLGHTEPDATTDILAPEELLSKAEDDFLLAARTAEHISKGKLTVHTAPLSPPEAVICDGELSLYSWINDNPYQLTFETEKGKQQAREHLLQHRSETDEYIVDSQPYSEIISELSEGLSEHVIDDFIHALEETPPLSEIDASVNIPILLVAITARHEELFYHLSTQAEFCEIASKATFSRAKLKLEEEGLIVTEQAPTNIGRPRQRLVPDDGAITNRTPPELVEELSECLADSA